MAITGTNTLSTRKKDLANQKSIAIGFKKTVFAHKAAAGETGISVGNLNVPTELTSAGFTNPSFGEIANAKMKQFRNNVRITSSAKGVLMDYLSYNIASSTQINWTGWTAEEGEIFTVEIDHNARTGMRVVDASPIVATGTIAAGAQDFSVGTPFEVNKYSSMQVGAVTVFVDGEQQYRNAGNATAAPGADGNYQEIDAGTGLGTIIRMNTVESYERNVTVISTGLVVEKPNESQLAEIEKVQGQVDKLVTTVAALAGVPETNFQAAPNQIQLKQFGDRVLTLEQNRARIDLSNAWTAFQNLPGRTDGNPVPTGYVGETVTTAVGSNFVTAVADTYVDGQTFTLQAGVWKIDVDVPLELGWISGTTQVLAYAAIRQGSTVLNQAIVRDTSMTSTQQNVTNQIHLLAIVNISTPTTYKLSVLCNQSAAAATARIYADNTNFTGSNGIATSKIVCTRIG